MHHVLRIDEASAQTPELYRRRSTGFRRATYVDRDADHPGEPAAPPGDLVTKYSGYNRELEIRFSKPLERFHTLHIELLDGILGTDGQPLKPWALSFVLSG